MNRILPVAVLLFLALPSAASDFQSWTELGVRYRISREFRLKFDQHFRFDEEFREYSRHKIMPELAAVWRVNRYLRFEAGYRYKAEITESREDPYTDSWHRFHIDARLRYRIKPIRLRYRLRVQEQFGKPWGSDALEFIHTIRNKIGIEANFPCGFVPFMSAELFLRVDVLHKWRLTAGLDYEFGSHTVTVFYRLEDMIADTNDANHHILGTAYHFSF
jgi:hypothetical protein